MLREDLLKLAREAVGGPHRPTYCKNPANFDPHEWVIEAMQRAYNRGRDDGLNAGKSAGEDRIAS